MCHYDGEKSVVEIEATCTKINSFLSTFSNSVFHARTGSDCDAELPLFFSLRRFHEGSSQTTTTFHKSVKRALKCAAAASTDLPTPKPQTIYQLKAVAKAKRQEEVTSVLATVEAAIRKGKSCTPSPQAQSDIEIFVRNQMQDLFSLLESMVPQMANMDLEHWKETLMEPRDGHYMQAHILYNF
ncbi:uncharacterized protein LOC117653269 [Thrips palmi]|uniref:Uncharacterized protein LOC117653269 n=1 Tax=Thrips palmi TaxID=161013 RepID=A0A6P9AB78_THRPL|nr:uncharacterized protein LOC117653269 [Thrips palmi]